MPIASPTPTPRLTPVTMKANVTRGCLDEWDRRSAGTRLLSESHGVPILVVTPVPARA
jgi:hypothetical protein